MIPLYPSHKKVLEFCYDFVRRFGWAASDTEISHAIGISVTAVRYAMQRLDLHGYLIYAGTRQYKVLWLP